MSKINIIGKASTLFLSLSILLSIGCANHVPSMKTDYSSAMNTKWVLEDIDGHGITDFAHIWLRFDGDRKIYGSGGCNNFRSNYFIENNEFKTQPFAMTRKACSPSLNIQESKFMQALRNIRTMHTQDNILYMTGSTHKLRFSKK
ncbi:META domain-containing protein [Maridesulfovibrio zosterae]|uniref:META domain-containing protein n=1 Tax=Maridesulfovibrio zosterae TaxID=82171 RepID=UPI0006883F2D|nr:META domain-containing protein [Maridesulfovibrio zosterae]